MAEKEDHLNITLYFQNNKDQAYDLRIPKNISVYHLLTEINKIFQKRVQPKKYQIKVKNKRIILDDNKKLKDYPLTSGDILEVIGE